MLVNICITCKNKLATHKEYCEFCYEEYCERVRENLTNQLVSFIGDIVEEHNHEEEIKDIKRINNIT